MPPPMPERTVTEASSGAIADALERALTLLRENGWFQGDYFSGPKLCATGAICAATGRLAQTNYGNWEWVYDQPVAEDTVNFYVRDGVQRALRAALPDDAARYVGVANYNDDPSTTFADIENLFKEAINIAKHDN